MKAAVLCMVIVCVLGTNIRASMMTFASKLEDKIKEMLGNDMGIWMPQERQQSGGIDEDFIHSVLQDYKGKGMRVTDEMLDTHDYVTRFDANQDGLIDSTEVVKLIKWFVRATYPGSDKAESLILLKEEMERLGSLGLVMDMDSDGKVNIEDTRTGIRIVLNDLSIILGYKLQTALLQDYDFNSDELLDKTEMIELIKRCIRDFY